MWSYLNFLPGNIFFSKLQAESYLLPSTKRIEQGLLWLTLLGSFRHHLEVNGGMIKDGQ